MRKLFSLALIALLALSLSSYAQDRSGKISGQVIDGSTKTIESATITLLWAKDSTVAKMGVADKTGKFHFENLANGVYIVSVSAVGHALGFSEKAELTETVNQITLKTIELFPVAKSMTAVTVTSKKPLIEQKAGKTVINVEASQTNTGLNALELLEKSPGVSVDNDGNISVKGKQGVTILIDGKPTYLSGADLAALLKNMQSSSLEQIEVMTNPPAKYDASGNSGIINIKTKKGLVKGMNGSVNGGYTQGLYGRYNGGINLNYRNNKLNLFGGYNGGKFEGYNNLTINRNIYDKNMVLKSTIDQLSRPHFEGNYHNLKLGLDYNFSKRTVAGFVVNGGFSRNNEDPHSNTNIRDRFGALETNLLSFGDNVRRNSNFSTNFNIKHTFDSTGKEITADLDYVYYRNRSNTELTTRSFDKDGVENTPTVLRGLIPSDINIYSGKIDYTHPFRNGWKMEAGIKSSLVKTDNMVGYLRNNVNDWDVDKRSNHFIYEENINAAYTIFSKTIKKWEINAGLRVENTIAKGYQFSNDSSFKRNYTNLFPNLGLSYNASEKNQFSFSYSRRVQRPSYEDLNPFIFFLDSLTYGQGNPYLQPQFTHNLEASHTWNRILTTTVNYTQTDDIITQLLKQNSETNETFQTRENFSTMKQIGVAVMANVPITKWWNANMYVNVFNNHYNGIYNSDPIDIQFSSMQANMTNSFTLGKGWNAEISGWYRTKTAEGLLIAKQMGAVNSGLSKQFMKKKATVKIGVRDIFYTQQFRGYAKYSDVDVKVASKRDTRQFNLSFTYRFGKTSIASERRRKNGATDEQNRVNTGGN